MHLLSKKIAVTFFVCMLAMCVAAQTKFTATIKPEEINKDEYATLRLVVENATDIRNITPPSLKDFVIVSGPNQESGMSSVNGAVTQYVAVSYVLQPRKPGRISINPAIAIIGTTVLKSNAVKLAVNNAVSSTAAASNTNTNPLAGFGDPFEDNRPAAPDFKDYILHNGENVQDKVAKNMQLRLQTDKTTCYVGEPIVATYKLFTRLKSESRLSKNPSFNGFSVIDLSRPDITDYKRESLDGRDYNAYIIRKAQLYPLQSGEIELETAVLDNDIQFLKDDGKNGPNSVNDLMNGFNMDTDATITQSVSLASKPVMITVKPLPEEGKPAFFKGAVGNFTIESALAKPTFSTDETGSFAVRISGAGNLQLLNAPDIAWPDDIDVFEPKVADNTVTTTVPVSGNKTYVFPFAAQKEGNYILPALRFSFFDPETAAYKIIETKPIPFTVTKGTGRPAYNIAKTNVKEDVSFLNNIFSHRWWIIAFIALVILVSVVLWMRKENKREKIAAAFALKQKLMLEQEALVVAACTINQKNPLEETESCLYMQDCSEFYTVLNKEMKIFLAQKFSLDLQNINSKTIAAAMDKAGVANETALKLQQLLQEVEWHVYTPFVQDEKRNEIYSRALDMIQEIR